MVLEFKVGDKVIVDGEFEGEIFRNKEAVIKKVHFSNNEKRGEYLSYYIEYKKNDRLCTWWVVLKYEKTGLTGLKMTKIEKSEIKEEDIEWF
jgi:hypothetical protein